jgi:sugar phosphate isomerase/epimerase
MQFGAIEIMLPSDAPAALAEAAAAGFDGFEYYVDGPGPGDDPIWTPAGRTRVRRQAAESGIAVPSVCLGYFNYQAWLTADDPETRADARDAVRRAIDVAAGLDSEVVQVPFFGPAEITTETHEDRVVRGIEAVAADAAAAGVTLAIEDTLSAAENLALLERIDSPAVAHYYDVGNATALGYDAAAELRELGSHTAAIHIKDRMAEGEDPQQHGTMLGDADVDFEAVADALAEIGYDGWLILETPSPGDTQENAAENLAFARRVLA